MKKTPILAWILALLMALPLAGCGTETAGNNSNSGSDPNSSQSGTSDPGVLGSEAGLEDHYIAYTLLGEDWMLNYYESEAEWAVKTANPNNKYEYVSAEFTSDQMQSGIQSLISSGVDGIEYYGAFPVLNLTVAEMCADAGVPFSMPDQMPPDEQVETLLANPYFVGAFGASSYDVGYQMGQYAAQQGYRKALTIGGAVGDSAHDGRLSGFEAGFTEGGGTVIGTARCTSPGEATTKASDLLTAYPEADCFYAATGTYAGGAITAQENFSKMLMNFTTDVDKDLLAYIRSGDLVGDSGAVVVLSLSACLLQNYLDGHPIKDADGNAPLNTDLVNFVITADNVDSFEANFITEHPFSEETLQSLLWRYNNDVTYDDYCEIINNWTLEYAIDLKG